MPPPGSGLQTEAGNIVEGSVQETQDTKSVPLNEVVDVFVNLIWPF